MHICIDRFQICEGHLLLQDHLVERDNEEGVQKSTMENGQTHNSSNKLEVVQMFRVDARMRVDLQGIVVVRRILEKTVEGVEHLVRKQEEELSIEPREEGHLKIKKKEKNQLGTKVTLTTHVLMVSILGSDVYLERPP